MEITNTIINIFTPQGFTGFMQFLVVILEIIYILFAFILARQVKLMNSSFKTSMAFVFSAIANVHFWISVIVVMLSIIIL